MVEKKNCSILVFGSIPLMCLKLLNLLHNVSNFASFKMTTMEEIVNTVIATCVPLWLCNIGVIKIDLSCTDVYLRKLAFRK